VDPAQRPAFISWWDYGFYEVAVGGHPTVADNFQDGIPTAANFHTSTSEKEAVVVFSIRLLEGDEYFNNGELSENVVEVLRKYAGENNTEKIVKWLKNPMTSPSYGDPIGAEYDEETSKDYTVGQQYPWNAGYHDIVKFLTTNETVDLKNNITGIDLSDEEITCLYHDLQEATGFSIRYYGVEGYDRQIFNIFGFLSDKSILLVGAPEDDFIEILFNGKMYYPGTDDVEKEFVNEPLQTYLDLSDDEKRRTIVQNTPQRYKDAYFETMFYKTYIGPPKELEDGSKAEFDYQVPCINMKHFYAEYISDLSKFPYYNTGKGAVVIAKYYEGAYVNGTVTFNGDPVNAEVAAVSNLTYYGDLTVPIDHDKETTTNGNFSLIVGAGARLQIRRIYSEEIRPFVMKNVTFNGETGPETAPITDDDAMRKGTNYERMLNISIEPATLEGYIYLDNDDDGAYNKSVDTPLENVDVSVYDIAYALDPVATDITDESGFFNVSDLLPGYYLTRAEQNGFVLRDQLVELFEFDNYQNLSQSKHSAIEGKVFFEDETNTISDASVKLTYLRKDPAGILREEIFVDSKTTDANGEFAFPKMLLPGEYELNVTKEDKYRKVEQITLAENETLTHDISLEYTPATITGSATYNGNAVGAVDISFSSDESIENNTAVEQTVTSGEDGLYVVDLTPGNYNVIVGMEDEEILVYSFYDKLNVSVGEVSKSYNIPLSKNSVTVSGYTSFEGTNKVNITNIKFEPDYSVENNTAIYSKTVQSNEIGHYSLELSPGSYIVTVNHSFSENNQNYTYTFDGTLTIEENDIELGITYNIAMAKSETE